jgi:hypothetical protein
MSRIEITNLEQIPEWDRSRLRFGQEAANIILASPRFKEELLKSKMTETNGMTSQQVYDCIMKADQLNPLDKLDVLDIQIVMYNARWSGVVGYTYFESLFVWVNRKFFGTPKYVASNLIHEPTHQLGFGHGGKFSTSVPYTMNRIAEILYDELPECQELEKRYWVWWNS